MERLPCNTAIIEDPFALAAWDDVDTTLDPYEKMLVQDRIRLTEKLRRNVRREAQRLNIPVNIALFPTFYDCEVNDKRRAFMLQYQLLACVDPSPDILGMMLEHRKVEPMARCLIAFTDDETMEQNFSAMGSRKLPDLDDAAGDIPGVFAAHLPHFTPDGQPHEPLARSISQALRYPHIPTTKTVIARNALSFLSTD